MFNHIIARFRFPQAIVTDHGSHFQNQMMGELGTKLGFCHENSSLYYPQKTGQVEAINKVMNTMLQCMVGVKKASRNLKLFSPLWAYQNSIISAIRFTPFQLVYGLEVVLLIESDISSLKLTVELLPHTFAKEERFLYRTKLDVTHCDATIINETLKNASKLNNRSLFNLTLSQKEIRSWSMTKIMTNLVQVS
jgi:hypothetical protein